MPSILDRSAAASHRGHRCADHDRSDSSASSMDCSSSSAPPSIAMRSLPQAGHCSSICSTSVCAPHCWQTTRGRGCSIRSSAPATIVPGDSNSNANRIESTWTPETRRSSGPVRSPAPGGKPVPLRHRPVRSGPERSTSHARVARTPETAVSGKQTEKEPDRKMVGQKNDPWS